MANIEAAAAAGKYSIIAYLDTVEIFFPPTLKPEQRRSLERTYRLEECDNRQGYRLISNQPSEETVRRLDRIAGKYRGVLSRVDVALDITGGDPQHIRDLIIRHAFLRWRRTGKGSSMHDVDNTTVYWVDTLTTKKNCWRKNLVVYADKPCRITSEVDCCHFELRLRRADTIRQQGIRRVSDLLTVNPRAFFDRHVGWSDIGDRYVKRVVRKHVKRDREHYRGKELPPYMDRYRSGLSRWVRQILHVIQFDRAQVLKDNRREMTKSRSLLEIPTVLTWPGGDTLISDKHPDRPIFPHSLMISMSSSKRTTLTNAEQMERE